MSDIWFLYSTFPNRGEALSAARALVAARLVACANVHEVLASVYRWEGKIEEAAEVVLMAKTTEATLAAAMDLLKRLHSYQLPCIVAWPVAEGYPPFLEWVRAETQKT